MDFGPVMEYGGKDISTVESEVLYSVIQSIDHFSLLRIIVWLVYLFISGVKKKTETKPPTIKTKKRIHKFPLEKY